MQTIQSAIVRKSFLALMTNPDSLSFGQHQRHFSTMDPQNWSGNFVQDGDDALE